MGKKQKKKIEEIKLKDAIVSEVMEDETEIEGDHTIDGYRFHNKQHYKYFNDDLSLDDNDYEVEQEKYAVQSEDIQPIAVDRYFERFGKSRRTPR